MPNGGEKQQKIAKDQKRRARDSQDKEKAVGIDLSAAYRALIEAYERERRRSANGRQE